MSGITTRAETGGGEGLVYLDESGGYISIAVTALGYVMTHKFHVAPFSVSEAGAYSTVGTGQETNVLETASNLVSLISGMYDSGSTIQAIGVYQVNSTHDGVTPTALDLSSAHSSGADTASGTGLVDQLVGFTGHGAGFSKWQSHFHGTKSWLASAALVRQSVNALSDGDPYKAFGYYISGQIEGGGLSGVGHDLFTQVVTHAGEQIVLPIYIIGSASKRIRRRYRYL